MKKPTPSQMDAARWMLADEGRDGESAEARAAAGRRVFAKTLAHLATLLGSFGAHTLFARSVKLTAVDFPRLRTVDTTVDGDEEGDDLGERIVHALRGEPLDRVTETQVTLYATLLAQLETLIGEQLTTTVLRDSWPAFRASPPEEETK